MPPFKGLEGMYIFVDSHRSEYGPTNRPQVKQYLIFFSKYSGLKFSTGLKLYTFLL